MCSTHTCYVYTRNMHSINVQFSIRESFRFSKTPRHICVWPCSASLHSHRAISFETINAMLRVPPYTGDRNVKSSWTNWCLQFMGWMMGWMMGWLMGWLMGCDGVWLLCCVSAYVFSVHTGGLDAPEMHSAHSTSMVCHCVAHIACIPSIRCHTADFGALLICPYIHFIPYILFAYPQNLPHTNWHFHHFCVYPNEPGACVYVMNRCLCVHTCNMHIHDWKSWYAGYISARTAICRWDCLIKP